MPFGVGGTRHHRGIGGTCPGRARWYARCRGRTPIEEEVSGPHRVAMGGTYPVAARGTAAGRVKGGESALGGLAVGNSRDIGLHIVLAALEDSSVTGRWQGQQAGHGKEGPGRWRRTKFGGTWLYRSSKSRGYGLGSQVVALGGGRKLGGLLAGGESSRGRSKWVLYPSTSVQMGARKTILCRCPLWMSSCQVVRDTSSCPRLPQGLRDAWRDRPRRKVEAGIQESRRRRRRRGVVNHT